MENLFEDLAARLERGPLGVDETLVLVRRLAEALAFAGEAGVVHRDLKPANIFLARGRVEEAKILDFGLARSDSLEPEPTRFRQALGTAAYMAPEQARCARSVGPAADVYSLGVVAYECLTGRRPFDGRTPLAVLVAALTDDPPRASATVEVPPALDALVARMLAREPAERPPDGAAVIAELARCARRDASARGPAVAAA